MIIELKKIPGFPHYSITNKGKIWSWIQLKWRKPSPNAQGYLQLCLRKEKHSYNCKVHRLVLEAFVGLCPRGMECRHLDGNKLNNNIKNLRWGTAFENAQDAIKHGTHASLRLKKVLKLTKSQEKIIIELLKTGYYTISELAACYYTTPKHIRLLMEKMSTD